MSYRLRCTQCGTFYDDQDGSLVLCTRPHGPALLRSVYESEFFRTNSSAQAQTLERYAMWLPTNRSIDMSMRASIYQAEGLAEKLGLAKLWIAFAGYSSSKNATLRTGSAKDLEAVAVAARLPDNRRILVAASAGNYAVALAAVAESIGLPLVLVMPAVSWLWMTKRMSPSYAACKVMLADGDFEQAEMLAARLGESPEFVYDGGFRNVARRDAAGTIMIAAAEAIGRLPDVFVQATGTGIGALGAHEAALRLVADGRFGRHVPRLLLAQNAPAAPVAEAWGRLAPRLKDEAADDVASPKVVRMPTQRAHLLDMRPESYAIHGGLFDAMISSGANAYGVTNPEIAAAQVLFENTEGIDIEPEAAVAIAALWRAVRSGAITSDDTVVLNITAGGRAALRSPALNMKPTFAARVSGDVTELQRSIIGFFASRSLARAAGS